MSTTRVKTTYEVMGDYATADTRHLYCDHHHGSDTVTFYDEDGSVSKMAFEEFSAGKDKWDAIQKLWFPFKGKWGEELLDGVEYYQKAPWDE